MATTYSTPFMQKPDAGFRLGDIRSIYDAVVNENAISAAYGIAAAGTTQATATALTSVINQVDTVAASSGVYLPLTTGSRTTPFRICFIIHNGASTLQVYASPSGSDTINGTAGATGIAQIANTNVMYISAKPGVWESIGVGAAAAGSFTSITNSGNFTETSVGSGFVQKAGTNGRAGTFSTNGTTTVTISNTSVAVTDFIGLSVNSPSTQGATPPRVVSISAGVFFTVVAAASDVSLYNYSIIGIN